MLTLHLEAATHEDLTRLAIKTLGIVGLEPISRGDPIPVPIAAEAPPAPAATLPAPAPHTPRAPRKSRTAPSAAAATPPPPAAAAPSPAPAAAPAVAAHEAAATAQPAVSGGFSSGPVPTIDELRAALGEVNSVFGMATCTNLLADFGAQRVSLVPEEKRAEFIKLCKEKVAKNAAEVAASKAAKA